MFKCQLYVVLALCLSLSVSLLSRVLQTWETSSPLAHSLLELIRLLSNPPLFPCESRDSFLWVVTVRLPLRWSGSQGGASRQMDGPSRQSALVLHTTRTPGIDPFLFPPSYFLWLLPFASFHFFFSAQIYLKSIFFPFLWLFFTPLLPHCLWCAWILISSWAEQGEQRDREWYK